MSAAAPTQSEGLVEGEEEVQYVFVSLPSDLDPVAFGPGQVVTIEGLATEQPTLHNPSISQLPGGVTTAAAAAAAGGSGGSASAGANGSGALLQGQYVDNLGSILLMKEAPVVSHNQKPTFVYVGHTDKQLQFQKPS